MKRIEFIAPVEAMRGNLSGSQKGLEYPIADNKAFESPVGTRNYAKNYRPSFIGAKRAKDGLKYFAVKTKSAVGMTVKSKKQMALLGGAGAIIAAILRDKSSALYTATVAAFNVAKTTGQTTAEDLRQWMSSNIMKSLGLKRNIVFSFRVSASETFRLNNPWVEGGAGVDVPITDDSLARFWMQLANNPIEFYVDGLKGIAHQNDTFNDLIGSPYNVLGLSKATVDSTEYVKLGDSWLQEVDVTDPTDVNYVASNETVQPAGGDVSYSLNDVAPEA